jgi:hypothetical protein
LVVQLGFNLIAPVRLIPEGRAGHGSTDERTVDTRVAEPSDLAVLDGIERQQLAGDIEQRFGKAAGDPQHRLGAERHGLSSEVEGTGVIEIDPIGKLFGPIQGDRINRPAPGQIPVEVVLDPGQRGSSSVGESLQNGREAGVVGRGGSRFSGWSNPARPQDGPSNAYRVRRIHGR